jgi:hypothetical protein
MPRTLFAAALTACLAAATFSHDARAQSCGMGEVDFYPTEHTNVAQAEDLLSRGETKDAAWLLQKTWPRLREAIPVAQSVPVIAEGVRVMALAAVRSDGDIKTGLGWSSATAADRASNVAWGVSRLRMLAKAMPSDSAKADLGEALARSPKTRGEGLAILEGLASAGSLYTPDAYAALALARSMEADEAGARVAAAQCEIKGGTTEQCTALGGRVIPALATAE